MRICDIPVAMVRLGKNWRFVPDDSEVLGSPMERWEGVEDVAAGQAWLPDDSVIYSGLIVLSTGQVVPMLCLKEALCAEIGGDYCWFVNGRWRQLGVDHILGVEIVSSHIASPLICDPSFDCEDGSYRAEEPSSFRRYVDQLSAEVSLVLRPR